MASKRPSSEGGAPQLPASKHIKREGTPTQGPPHPLLQRGVRYPCVWYKDGEPLPGLQQIYDRTEGEDRIVEVLVHPDALNSSTNRRVKARQLWGDRIYTGDSDLVAVLMHLGYYSHNCTHPPSQVQEFHALLRLLPPQASYASRARFIKSRSWHSTTQGCSYQVECCWLVTKAECIVELQPCLDEAPAPYPTVHSHYNRQMLTRSTGRQAAKAGQDVSVQFNLCNEPWLKYSLSSIADRGSKPSQWTSSQLLDRVMLFETACVRYQVARTGEVSKNGNSKDQYTLSRCNAPLPLSIMRHLGVPLPSDQVVILEEGLAWEDFQWGVNSVVVRGRELLIRRMHFEPRCSTSS